MDIRGINLGCGNWNYPGWIGLDTLNISNFNSDTSNGRNVTEVGQSGLGVFAKHQVIIKYS